MLTETATCRHHWVLGADQAPETRGVCKNCGSERTFQNHLPGDRFSREWRSSRSSEAIAASRRPMRAVEGESEKQYAE